MRLFLVSFACACLAVSLLSSCAPDLSFRKTVSFSGASTSNVLGSVRNATNLRTGNVMKGVSYRTILAIRTSDIMGHMRVNRIGTSAIGMDYIMVGRYSTAPLP